MYILGLTGPTGAGKSLVATYLAGQHGFAVLDADRVARSVVEPGTPCLRELSGAFGGKILRQDGSLDRKALAAIAFSDPDQLKKLNSITHPHILIEMRKQLEALGAGGVSLAVLDAPALFEAGAQSLCDRVLVVTAPHALRRKRIMSRDNLTEREAERRISAQPDEAFYLAGADYVISSERGTKPLLEQADAVLRQIRACPGGQMV